MGRLADGRAVFVPRTAPGDLVELADVRPHARFARARAVALVEPGPGRVTPRCRHYEADRCGGCQWQHLDDATQQGARRALVGDALRRIAKLDLPDPALEPAPAPFSYRTRVTLHIDAAGHIGLHPFDQPGQVFDLERCEIAAEPLNATWGALRGARVRWPRALEQVVLRLDRGGAVHVVLRGPVAPEADALPGADRRTFWWSPGPGRMQRVRGVGEGPAGSFEQVHPAMGDRVRAWAVDALGDVSGLHAWDLYAGLGEAGHALAARGATVESVELDADAVAWARRSGPPGVRRRTGRVEEWLGRLGPPAVVITNPPRAGMAARVVEGLTTAAPRTIVYVSCDPATLARDLSRLSGRYRVSTVRAFDLFPQTAHIETVVCLERV